MGISRHYGFTKPEQEQDAVTTERDKEKLRTRTRKKRVPLMPEDKHGLLRKIENDDLFMVKPIIPIAEGLLTHIAAIGALMTVTFIISVYGLGVTSLATAIFLAVTLAPLFRGLENLVHGASHYDVFGQKGHVAQFPSKQANDFVSNVLFASPVCQDVVSFRMLHVREHHMGFGGKQDPCLSRMQVHDSTKEGLLPSVWKTLKSIPKDTVNFYKTVGSSPRLIARATAWHGFVYCLPVALIFGFEHAIIAWVMLMLTIFSFTLPIVRTLAEAGEHDYRERKEHLSVSERTYSHDGFLNSLFHLFGDRWHVEHHLVPGIPQYNLHRLRDRLIGGGLGTSLKRRRSLLGPVETFVAENITQSLQKDAVNPSMTTLEERS